LKSLSWRSQRTIEAWNVEHDGHLVSVQQIANGDLGVMVNLDARFLLHFAPDQEGDNFEGISVLRAMYGNWLRKNSFLKLLGAGMEKYAIPTPVMKVPDGARGKPEFASAEKALKCYTSNQANYLMIPAGWELTFNNVSFDAQKVRETVDFENKEMVNSILASFLLLGQNGSGSLALSGTLSDFFSQTITYLSDHISENFQRKIIQPLIKMNFGDVPCLVELRCDSLEDKIDQSWATVVNTLSSQGFIKADHEIEKFIREKLKLPEMIEVQEQNIQQVIPQDQEQTQTVIEPQVENVQQSVLNGAQVASMVQIVQSVASGFLPRESGVEIIKTAFNLDTINAERLLGSAGRGFKIEQPEQAKTFSENVLPQTTNSASDAPNKSQLNVSLAEKKKFKKQNQSATENLIRDSAKEFKDYSSAFLKPIAYKYAQKMVAEKNAQPEAKIFNVANMVEIPNPTDYKSLLHFLYLKTTANAKTEIKNLILPKQKTLSEFRLAMTRQKRLKNYNDEIGSLIEELNDAVSAYLLDRTNNAKWAEVLTLRKDIEELSKSAVNATVEEYALDFAQVQRAKAKAETLIESQIADIKKGVGLQYQSSVTQKDITDFELIQDLDGVSDKLVDTTFATGADVQASQLVNEARLDGANEASEESGDRIVSWTYVAIDDDVTTDLCKELNGHTFAEGDPLVNKYTPPLHFNCRSYMQVNMASFDDNPEIDAGEPKLSDKAQKQFRLSERGCGHTHHELAEYKGKTVELDKPFRTPDAQKKFGVYVKNEKGNVVLVRFGDSNMEIKRDDIAKRNSFRARHQCDTKPANKWEPRYWSCKFWSDEKVGDLI
jgi:SPP1 gp7 family putative phage head morphogenesis protein